MQEQTNPFEKGTDKHAQWEELDCHECRAALSDSMYPRHSGSRNCNSGSIASGGNRSHCTCDTCF